VIFEILFVVFLRKNACNLKTTRHILLKVYSMTYRSWFYT